jgi:uncharacterized protein (TIGR02466 family)
MNEELIDLFPTRILRVGNFLDKRICEDIHSYINVRKKDSSYFKYHECATNKSKTTFNSNLGNIIKDIEEHVPSSRNLENRIFDYVKILADQYNMKVSYLSNSWINIQTKESVLVGHVHSINCFSGALYINADEKSSRLSFYNPSYIHNFFHMYSKEINNFNCVYESFSPEIGDLYLFPGWIKHGSFYEQNMSDERIVLSFNYIIEQVDDGYTR